MLELKKPEPARVMPMIEVCAKCGNPCSRIARPTAVNGMFIPLSESPTDAHCFTCRQWCATKFAYANHLFDET